MSGSTYAKWTHARLKKELKARPEAEALADNLHMARPAEMRAALDAIDSGDGETVAVLSAKLMAKVEQSEKAAADMRAKIDGTRPEKSAQETRDDSKAEDQLRAAKVLEDLRADNAAAASKAKEASERARASETPEQTAAREKSEAEGVALIDSIRSQQYSRQRLAAKQAPKKMTARQLVESLGIAYEDTAAPCRQYRVTRGGIYALDGSNIHPIKEGAIVDDRSYNVAALKLGGCELEDVTGRVVTRKDSLGNSLLVEVIDAEDVE